MPYEKSFSDDIEETEEITEDEIEDDSAFAAAVEQSKPPRPAKHLGGWRTRLVSIIPGKVGKYDVESWDINKAYAMLADGRSVSVYALRDILQSES